MALRVVFFGSPVEAVASLETLIQTGHDVAAVYTRPDERAGRSRKTQPTPVRAAAESLGLPIKTPKGLRGQDVQLALKGLEADLFVVVAYGRILPEEVLDLPRLGTVNIHPSLLPRYRGPSPVLAAILSGDSETGVSLMLLDEGMDTGPILAQSDPVPLKGGERTGELTSDLFELGAQMLTGVIEGLEDGSLKPQPQDENLASVTSLIKKKDGLIDWSRPAVYIERMTRAYDPWPGAFTSLRGKNLKIIEAGVFGDGGSGIPSGQVSVQERKIYVGTGEDLLELLQVQPEGKRVMTARDFLNGTPDLDGEVFDS